MTSATGPRSAEPLLLARDIEVAFGRVQVLFGCGIEVHDGERVALLGTNGAGKSTLLRAVSGALSPSAGSVRFDGRDVLGLPPERRFGLGMVLVSGGKATFPSLTVHENLRLGGWAFWSDRDRLEAAIDESLELFPQLQPRLRQAAGTLSGGEQQMMALARGLIAGPKLLLIDELSLGLAPIVMQQIVEVIEELGRRGRTMLIVEQSINVAFGIAERAYFMEKGETRFSGPVAELMERGDLVRSVFFGS